MRIRFTRKLPIGGEHIGLTVWVGSIARGWVGKPVAPWRWYITYRISSVAGKDAAA